MRAIVISIMFIFIISLNSSVQAARYGSDEPGEVGDIVHRTSPDGLMWGLDGYTEGVMDIFSIHPGHAGIFVGISNDSAKGFQNSVPQVVEAVGRPPNSGVVEINNLTDFCSQTSMVFLGAQTTENLTSEQRANMVILACDQLGEGYNENMSGDDQKGPDDDQWICSGFAEKMYESCNKNFGMSLSYYHEYPYEDEDGTVHSYPGYGWGGVDITPDGRIDTDDNQVSESVEQTRITTIWPAYLHIFFPYTQMIQDSLVNAVASPPATEVTFNPSQPNGENGWYTVDVEITIAGNDGDYGSGIYYIKYSIGDGDWFVYESPLTLSETDYLFSYAKDNAGNYPDSVTPNAFLKIDKEGPQFGESSNTINPTPGVYEFVQVTSDANSGLLDDLSSPLIYYSWNKNLVNEDHNNGYIKAIWQQPGGQYGASFTVETSHIGDRLFWRCLSTDEAGNQAWSEVHEGGLIGGGSAYTRIIEETDPDFANGSMTGKVWNYYTNGAYKGYYYTYGDDLTGVDCWASWTPALPVSGYYDLYACFWGGWDRSSQIPISIQYKDGVEEQVLSQHHEGEDIWFTRYLGTFPMLSGSDNVVELGDNTGEPYDGYTVVLADTVKFIYQRPLESPTPTATPIPPESPTPTLQPSLPPTPIPTLTPNQDITPTPSPPPTSTPRPTSSISPIPTSPYSDTPTPTPFPTPRSPFPINDFNGDGVSDIAIFRPSTGLWAIRGISRCYFGQAGDIPVGSDYNGDGTTNKAVFRAGSGLWAVGEVTRIYFGSDDDLALPGDYDGDRTADFAIFRPASGLWAIRSITRTYFGSTGDSPVPGYYKEDVGRQIAIFRRTSGLWALKDVSRIYFGSVNDQAVHGDYDYDGVWEVGIFRPLSGLWAIRGVTRSYFGSFGDIPVPANYRESSITELGIFRERSGLWAIRGVTRCYFGTSGDIPIAR